MLKSCNWGISFLNSIETQEALEAFEELNSEKTDSLSDPKLNKILPFLYLPNCILVSGIRILLQYISGLVRFWFDITQYLNSVIEPNSIT